MHRKVIFFALLALAFLKIERASFDFASLFQGQNEFLSRLLPAFLFVLKTEPLVHLTNFQFI
ncbi:hypothetical protein B4123_2101 [Bacillus paralicheniformis]|nr:hypothetical protein B4123_2101 [Bacillus paralicheniformis]